MFLELARPLSPSAPASFALDGGEVIIGPAHALGVNTSDLALFYSLHWARPICLGREDFAAWQMCGAPESQGLNASVVAVRGGQLLAAMGVTPATFNLDGTALAGAELTTWIVLPGARGLGIGQRMLAHLQTQYDILAGAGISAAALPLYLGVGFAFLAQVPRFFHIADFQKVRAFVDAPDAAFRLTTKRQQAGPFRQWQATPCSSAALAPQAAIGAMSQAFFRRDALGLAWRYDQHPTFRYEAFSLRSRDTAGHGMGVVLREDMAVNTPILHLVDLFGDARDAAAALSFVEAKAVRRGAAFVDFSATAGALTALVRARGWSSAVDDPLVELPSLFHPVEMRRPTTTSLVLWSREGRARLFDFGRLHLTKGDLDLDRPTISFLEGRNL